MCGIIPPLPNTPSWRGAQLLIDLVIVGLKLENDVLKRRKGRITIKRVGCKKTRRKRKVRGCKEKKMGKRRKGHK